MIETLKGSNCRALANAFSVDVLFCSSPPRLKQPWAEISERLWRINRFQTARLIDFKLPG